MRTELYGCYRKDGLAQYTLSQGPLAETPEVGLDQKLTGIGRLNDGNVDEYLKFKKNTEEKLVIDFKWAKPVNISELIFHISARSNSCVQKITIVNDENRWMYNLGCSIKSVGPRIVPLLVARVVDQMTIEFDFSGSI